MSTPSKKTISNKVAIVEPLIHVLRGQQVILDADLARIYGVSTKRLNEQLRRNHQKFPKDFLFRLTKKEVENLRSQNATSSSWHGGRRYFPYAFTEHGTIMAATILNSPQAIRTSVLIVRAFVRMKKLLSSSNGLSQELEALKKELRGRLDVHESAINDILSRIMLIIDPPASTPEPASPKREIGFHAP